MRFKSQFKGKEFERKFASLYTLYSIPNFIFPIVFGFLTYKFGDHRALSILSIFVATGSCLIGIGCYTTHFLLIQIGRLIYACGGDSIMAI